VDSVVDGLVISGAATIGISGAKSNRHFIEESNLESNSSSLACGEVQGGAVPLLDDSAVSPTSSLLTSFRKGGFQASGNNNAPALPLNESGGTR
jgi:hypothetical protein